MKNNRLIDNDIRLKLIQILGIQDKYIKKIKVIGGMTNKNYLIIINKKKYVLRIPGLGTTNMINRINEKRNLKKASLLGIEKELIYFNLDTGIKLSTFIEGAKTLNSYLSKQKENLILTANLLNKLHNSNIIFENNFCVFNEIKKYENLIKNKEILYSTYKNYKKNKIKIFKLEKILKNLGLELKPCHNDTVPENFVKNNKGKIFLIDWEYSGMNEPMWDLAAHSLEVGFNKREEEMFLYYYFKKNVTTKNRLKIEFYKILQDFLWSIWTILKEENGDDFGNYGLNRYENCIKRLIKYDL